MISRIKSADIKPGDIIKFEYGTYDNWITVRIDEVSNSTSTYYPLKLIWHYLSDEKGAPKDCRAEKLGNNPAPKPYRQFTSYSNPNDLIVKLTQKGTTHTMENNQSQGKIIIEVQPEGGINPTTGKPCDGSISIQIKATLSKDDRVMILHALATSLSQGNNIETLSLLHTARKLALHTYLTGESCCDVYEQTPDGTLIDKRFLDALRKKRGEDN